MWWIRTINRVGMWLLIVVPVLVSGLNNIREQLGQGVGRHWDSWSDALIGWGMCADLPVEQPTKFELVVNSASRKS